MPCREASRSRLAGRVHEVRATALLDRPFAGLAAFRKQPRMVRCHIRERAKRSDGEDPDQRRKEAGEACGYRHGQERQVPSRSAGAQQGGGEASRRKGTTRRGPVEREQEHQRRLEAARRRADSGREDGRPGNRWQGACRRAEGGGQARRREAWPGTEGGAKAGGSRDRRLRGVLARKGREHCRGPEGGWCGGGEHEAEDRPSGRHKGRTWPDTERQRGGREPPERATGRQPAGKGWDTG
jgi:hypothetical protein